MAVIKSPHDPRSNYIWQREEMNQEFSRTAPRLSVSGDEG